MRKCFYDNRRRYGTRRIAKKLGIGRFRVRTAMKRENLTAIAPKRFKPQTTDSKHDARISPNLLQDGVNAPSKKGEVIVGDITYLPLKGGKFCYLACFQDKFTRRIVGWQVSYRMTTQLVMDALGAALKKNLIKSKAIIHTDRGSQYAATEYQRLLYIRGYRQSMSRKGKGSGQRSSGKFLFQIQGRITGKRHL